MNTKVYAIGLGGGLLVTLALYYPLYIDLPSTIVEGWQAGNSLLAQVGYLIAAVLLIGTGYLGARLGYAPHRWAATGLGALAGLTAALLAYSALIGASMGVLGGQPMLAQGLHASASDRDFLMNLSFSVLNIHWNTYLAATVAIFSGLGLGALGGGWHGPSTVNVRPHPLMGPLLSLIGTLTGALVTVVAIVIYALLGPAVQRTADENTFTLPHSSDSFTVWTTGVLYAILIAWAVVALYSLWTARPLPKGQRFTLLTIGYINGLLPIATTVFILVVNSTRPLFVTLGLALWSILGGLILQRTWRWRSVPASVEAESPLNAEFFALLSSVGVGILFVTSYLGSVASALNLVLIPVSLIVVQSETDPALAAQAIQQMDAPISVAGLVQANYTMHFTILLGGLFALVIITVLALGIAQLMQSRNKTTA